MAMIIRRTEGRSKNQVAYRVVKTDCITQSRVVISKWILLILPLSNAIDPEADGVFTTRIFFDTKFGQVLGVSGTNENGIEQLNLCESTKLRRYPY